MAKLEIITIPDPLLRRDSAPVERVDDDLRRLVDDMLETMHAAPGIGLAGVQVGVLRRLLVIDIAGNTARGAGNTARGAGNTARGAGNTAKGEGRAKPGSEPIDDEKPAPLVMINPEILELGDELRPHEEGCLSIPEVYAEIERPASCTVRFLDRDGKFREMIYEGVLSTVVQHEVDHLDGLLFIDYLSRLRRDRIVKRFVKARRLAGDGAGAGGRTDEGTAAL